MFWLFTKSLIEKGWGGGHICYSDPDNAYLALLILLCHVRVWDHLSEEENDVVLCKSQRSLEGSTKSELYILPAYELNDLDT